MPTSDIPPAPAEPLQIPDEFIGTRQLSDLAVTVTKTDEPLQIATVSALSALNADLDTSLTEVMSVSIPIASWAGVCYIVSSGRLQWSNASGANQNMYALIRIAGSTGGVSTEITLTNGTTGANAMDYATSIVAPGSTVTVEMVAKVTTSTNDLNNGYLSVLGLVTR